MEQRVVKVDLLDYLFSNPGVFMKLDPEGKRKIFNSRPQPVLDSVPDSDDDKIMYINRFDPKYYDDFPWMTACPKRKVLFCYVCLLQGNMIESVICAKKDIVAAAQQHEMTASHITSHEACLRVIAPAQNQNSRKEVQQLAQKKRALLGKLLQVLYLLKCQNYFEKLRKSREFSIKTIDFLALNGINFATDWNSFFPELMKNPKKEASLFSIFRAHVVKHIKHELSQAQFVSLQIEDVSEFIVKPTVSVSFRYIINNTIYERFGGFYEVVDHSCKIDDGTLIDILQYWEIGEKVIGISSDFHMERIPTFVPDRPFNLFNVCSVHHKMNYVIVKIASIHQEMLEFLGKIKTVVDFSRDVSEGIFTRNDETNPKRIPDNLKTKDGTIDSHISSVYTQHKSLVDLTAYVQKIPNVPIHHGTMNRIFQILSDPIFIFYCSFFVKLFEIGNDMNAVLNGSFDDQANVLKVSVFSRIRDLTGQLGQIDSAISKLVQAKYSYLNRTIIAALLKDFDLRDENQSQCAILKFFNLNKNRDANTDVLHEARTLMKAVVAQMKGILDFKLPKLKSEVDVIFKDPSKAMPARKLFERMVASGSIAVYTEFAKLLKFYLTLPTCPIDDVPLESTFHRIKSCCRVTRGVGEFFDLDYLFIENDLSLELLAAQKFLDSVVTEFAKTDCMSDLILDRNVQ